MSLGYVPSEETMNQLAEYMKPWDRWSKQCHAAALHLVRSGLLPEGARVARGASLAVPGQHSWAVVGDPFQGRSLVLDPTKWSYVGSNPGLLIGGSAALGYRPHGSGSIWDYGKPPLPTGPVIELERTLSTEAKSFLSMAAPEGLDIGGWNVLAHAPVQGWPSAEIIDAMCDVPSLEALIPIDIVGMLTDRNPCELYW